MTDCLQTLHIIMRSPAELAQAQADIAAAWNLQLSRAPKTPRVRLVATGAAAARHGCPAVRGVILKTEKHWSKS